AGFAGLRAGRAGASARRSRRTGAAVAGGAAAAGAAGAGPLDHLAAGGGAAAAGGRGWAGQRRLAAAAAGGGRGPRRGGGAEARALSLPAVSLELVGVALRQRGEFGEGAAVLELAQQRYPADFWLNTELGVCLRYMQPPRPEDALRYFQAALAAQPQFAWAHN